MKPDERKEFLEFLEFLTSHETLPVGLKELVQKDIQFSLNRNNILTKFILIQLLGAALTLTFCPQFGIGFPEGHGITHVLRMYGDWACAVFCGSLFLFIGTLLSTLIMNSDETFWIWKRYKFPLIVLPTMLWVVLMLLNFTWKLEAETLQFHIIWILSGIITQEGWLFLKSKSYHGVMKRAA